MNSQVEDVKSRIDIADLIGSYLKLQKAGVNFKARCPFHNEKTASFFVSPARQIWHCFGCQKGGDAFKFLMEIEGFEFREALENLANRVGIELKKESAETKDERSNYFAITEAAANFFESHLFLPLGGTNEFDNPMAYLRKRGLIEETIKEFRLGYALNDWRELLNHLVAIGFKESDIEKTGLILKSQNEAKSVSRYYDRFRGRIMFPIFNHSGKIVAFGGRVFPENVKSGEGVAKYINSPETKFYQKSKILYGFHKSKIEILRNESCVIVEGYVDFLSVFQSGTNNVVATSGTALTQDQLGILRKYCEKIVVGFDMDFAGENASGRGIDLALNLGFDVKILKFKEGYKDPADVLAENKEFWLEALRNARHVVQFYIDSALNKFTAGSSELSREIQKKALFAVASLSSDLEIAHWVRKIAEILNIKEEAVWGALQKTHPIIRQDAQSNDGVNQISHKAQTRKGLLENKIIAIAAKFPQFLENKSNLIDHDFYKEKKVASQFALEAEIFLENFADAEAEFTKCVKELNKENLREKMKILSHKINFAEKNKNTNLQELLSEFKNLSAQINQMK